MSKTKIILTLTFLLVFAAGAVVGMVPQRLGIGSHGGPKDDRSSVIARELNLTTDQREQMKKIWSDLGPGRPGEREHWDRRRQYQKERDDTIRALLTSEQMAKYDAIRKDYDDRVADLGKERQAAFQQAVEKTKAILTPEQAAKYDALLKHREPGPGGPNGPGGPPQWRGGDHDHHPGDGPPSTRRAD